jgi:hypothetical protein
MFETKTNNLLRSTWLLKLLSLPAGGGEKSKQQQQASKQASKGGVFADLAAG